jgi:AraC family transcriptional regulator
MEPRFENGRELLICGLSERYNMSNADRIPALWERFDPHIGGRTAYGVISLIGDAGDFDYLCGVEGSLPPEFTRLRIPAHAYAVFTHDGPVSTIRKTFQRIFTEWVPKSGRRLADTPRFERYSEDFDKNKGRGSVEIWIPITDDRDSY